MTPRIAVLLLLCAGFLAACGDDDVGFDGVVVGGDCQEDRDCEFRCQEGGAFPHGTCTVPCNVDADCPFGTYCVDKEGGICLLGCEQPSDCRNEYTCKGIENRGHGGDSLVCIHE